MLRKLADPSGDRAGKSRPSVKLQVDLKVEKASMQVNERK